MNATPELEGWDDWLSQYIAAMPPEERLAGLAPEQRLAGLTPEEALLALPAELLRSFPATYLATLSEPIQARIRARLGR